MLTDPQSALRPEEKLLLALCRLDFNQQLINKIKEVSERIEDWDYFVRLSNEHGIIALVWHNILVTDIRDNLPTFCAETLHSGYMKSLVRNSFLWKMFSEIKELAEKSNIPVIPLKGLALEKTVYGNTGLRQMIDIDILVRQEQAALLRNILLSNGFESVPMISRFHEKIMPAYGKHLPELFRNGVAVEIHFKLFEQKGNLTTEEFFPKAHVRKDNENEPGLLLPDPQLLFLYLIKHLAWHEKRGLSQLRLYTDLILMITAYNKEILNLQLIKYAQHANLWEPLVEKLYLMEIYWNIKLPSWIKEHLRTNDFNKIQQDFKKFLRTPFVSDSIEEQENLYSLINDVPGFSNKILLLAGHIFPSLDYVKYRYNTNSTIKTILYYPVRWMIQFTKLFNLKN